MSGPNAGDGGRRLAGYRVLIAEDCTVNRLLLQGLLARQCERLVCVEGGRQAVELVRREGAGAFDILISDVQMPGMGGCAAATLLRAEAPGLPVVGLTGSAEAEDIEACRAAGMLELVPKPFDLDTLVAAIRRHARKPA